MHAIDFYISTCRCVMQADPDNPETWADLHRLLPCLRQSLGCYVCFNILQDPMGPSDNVCKHSVCQKCVGGKMKLKPACSWCKDHWFFQPNNLQAILVKCFKKLCLYILSSPLGVHIGNSSPVNGQSNNVFNILKEAADFNYTENSLQSEIDTSTYIEEPRIEPSVSFNTDKPEPSSDEDKPESDEDDGRLVSSESEGEDSVADDTKHQSPKKMCRAVTQKNAQVSDKINGVVGNKIAKSSNKRVAKTVVFYKRVSENKKSKLSQSLKKKAMKRSAMRKKRVSFFKNKHSSVKEEDNAPNDLEKMDFTEPNLKKIKQELPPPELKPFTSCKCGKSGNSNQLTCLGQRCQCYSMKLPCIGCKCRGCRNPKKGPDSSSYPTSGIYGTSYLRSGTKSLQESVCVNM